MRLSEQSALRAVEHTPDTGTGATPLPFFPENPVNKDQVKGKVKQVKGNVKETVGKVTGDKTMENKGKAQDTIGKIQEGYGDVKNDLRNGS